MIFIILLRFIGISLFYLLYHTIPLIICPDLFKEVLLYNWFIYPINTTNFSLIYLCKVIFEYLWHTYHNPNDYKNSLDQ